MAVFLGPRVVAFKQRSPRPLVQRALDAWARGETLTYHVLEKLGLRAQEAILKSYPSVSAKQPW